MDKGCRCWRNVLSQIHSCYRNSHDDPVGPYRFQMRDRLRDADDVPRRDDVQHLAYDDAVDDDPDGRSMSSSHRAAGYSALRGPSAVRCVYAYIAEDRVPSHQSRNNQICLGAIAASWSVHNSLHLLPRRIRGFHHGHILVDESGLS